MFNNNLSAPKNLEKSENNKKYTCMTKTRIFLQQVKKKFIVKFAILTYQLNQLID